MAYAVPDLPYAFDALEPHIDERDDAHPPRQAPPGLRDEGQRARWRAPSGPTGRSRRSCRASTSCPRTSARRSATTAAATTTTRCSGSSMGPNGGGEPDGALAEAIDSAFGSFGDFQAQAQGRRRRAVSAPAGRGWSTTAPGSRSSRPPNQDNPISERQDAAAGRRRLGARLLPASTRTAVPTTSTPGGTSVNWAKVAERFAAAR